MIVHFPGKVNRAGLKKTLKNDIILSYTAAWFRAGKVKTPQIIKRVVIKMKRSFRFYFALFFAKCTALVLRLIGRKGTSMPGSWAIILCPDFLGRMPRPKTVIGITGTNGKTTVANMVEDVLQDCGYDFTCNRSGTNVGSGVASSLIADSTLFGKPKKELAVFELDERSSPKVMPYLKPDLLLCTNIFRDSYKRNAHMEFILDILNTYIPDHTQLLLNGDDLLCSGLKPQNQRMYYGVKKLPGETGTQKNIVCDVSACPNCGGKLDWDFVRYHHIGHARCNACGFHTPDLDYAVEATDAENHSMTVQMPDGQTCEFPLANAAPINIYNSLSAVTLLCAFGVSTGQIQKSMGKLQIHETRYLEETVGEKKVILHLAKGQNPIACSRVFDNIRQYPGRKAVLLFLDDYFDATHSVENISWYYDTDFEFLNHPEVTQIIAAGARSKDCLVRLLLAGVPPQRITVVEQTEEAAAKLDPEGMDSAFILYDVYTIGFANRVKEQVKALLGTVGGGTGA